VGGGCGGETVWEAAARVNPREKERRERMKRLWPTGSGSGGCEPRSEAVVCFFTFDTEKIYLLL
jgi:hypothetical protein